MFREIRRSERLNEARSINEQIIASLERELLDCRIGGNRYNKIKEEIQYYRNKEVRYEFDYDALVPIF